MKSMTDESAQPETKADKADDMQDMGCTRMEIEPTENGGFSVRNFGKDKANMMAEAKKFAFSNAADLHDHIDASFGKQGAKKGPKIIPRWLP